MYHLFRDAHSVSSFSKLITAQDIGQRHWNIFDVDRLEKLAENGH